MGEIADCIEREIIVPASVERSWALVTDPEHLARWFDGASIEVREGAAASFACGAEAPSHGIVERVEPPRRLAWRWCLAPGLAVGAGPTTRVEITLAPAGAATVVRLTECGFATLSDADRARYQRGNATGWDHLLGALAALGTASRG